VKIAHWRLETILDILAVAQTYRRPSQDGIAGSRCFVILTQPHPLVHKSQRVPDVEI
jgi:hypothetical protein